MELFHGSIEVVTIPEIRKPNRTLDYGTGFYLTSSREQAIAWVKRKLNDQSSVGYLNLYHFDMGATENLKILKFDLPDEKWLDFVMANRLDRNFQHDYDVVIGPVADDKVYASFALYEAGLIDKHELIKELKTYKLVNQILLHTEKSLSCVKWIEAEQITR